MLGTINKELAFDFKEFKIYWRQVSINIIVVKCYRMYRQYCERTDEGVLSVVGRSLVRHCRRVPVK